MSEDGAFISCINFATHILTCSNNSSEDNGGGGGRVENEKGIVGEGSDDTCDGT